ncbi:unnamed protein product [Ilex paraguariensis]|uniref:Uncharacterized protein n=1 Tax=Ilex paraguariensis TaxID=185542 RepID=A0ABC8SU16_9AQUA
MLLKYKPKDKVAKKECLLKRAHDLAEGKTPEAKNPTKYDLDHVTYLIEQNKAQLLVIAHDVDPNRVGCLASFIVQKDGNPILHCEREIFTTVKNEDKLEFRKIIEAIKANFNDNMISIGSGVVGSCV